MKHSEVDYNYINVNFRSFSLLIYALRHKDVAILLKLALDGYLHPTHHLFLYSHWTADWVETRLGLDAAGKGNVSASGEISNSDSSTVQRIASHYIA